jgi:cytochrome c556
MHAERNSCAAQFIGIALAGLAVGFALTSAMAAEKWRIEWAEHIADTAVGELTVSCPVADPSDQAAFERCRDAAFHSKFLADNMREFILWGGRKDDNVRLEEANLTQFSGDIFRGLYLPLFMFTGKWTGRVDAADDRYVFRAEVRFRNQLQAGQYPYPFWHSDEKWGNYEKANEVVFTVDLQTAKIIGLQRSTLGRDDPEIDAKLQYTMAPPPRRFTKDEWMWRDENGALQPSVTLFKGLYSPDNPHLAGLEQTYVDFALELRNNTCSVCHVPNNPEKMKHLVLLQTPAHAAGEIERAIRAVEADAMPAESWAGPKGIRNVAMKAKFLAVAYAFKNEVDAAKRWEDDKRKKLIPTPEAAAATVAAVEPTAGNLSLTDAAAAAAVEPAAGNMSVIDVVRRRQASMKELGQHMRLIAAYLEGATSDASAIQPDAEKIKAIADQIPTLFPAGTGMNDGVAAPTGAKPDIWSDWSGFEGRSRDLSSAAAKLVELVAAGDKAATETQFQQIGRNDCGGCHQTFREKLDSE